MVTKEFLNNRAQFPHDQLQRYLGTWIAFSHDGTKIMADAETLALLNKTLATKHIDPQTVFLEYVHGPEDDNFFSPEISACNSPTKACP